MEHAGTCAVFDIPLERDLQTDPTLKNNIAALFKGLLTLNEMVTSGELDLGVLALQGLEAFKAKGLSETRPLDRKRYKEFDADSSHNVSNEMANDNPRLSRVHAEKFQGQSSITGEGEM